MDQLSLFESLTLAYVVHRLAEEGVAAVAVVGEIDEAAIEAAEGRSFPLLRLPDGVSLTELERTAVGSIVDHQANLQRRASDIHRQLSQLVFEGKGLQSVADRLAEICGKAVALEDDLFRLRHVACGPDVPDPAELDLGPSRTQVAEWVRSVALSSSQPPVGVFPLDDGRLVRVVAPVPSRDGVAGFLSIIGLAGSVTELDRLAAGRGAAVCAMEVAKVAAVDEAEARVRGDLLDQLLSTGSQDDQIVLGKARRLGYDPSLPSLVFAFRVTPRDRQSAGATVRSPERARSQLESLVRLELSRRESRCLVASRGPTVVALVPLQKEKAAEDFSVLADSVRKAAQLAMTGVHVGVGIGRPTSGAAGLAVAHREAEEALAIGLRIEGPAAATFFGRLGIVRLLAQVNRSAELESFHGEFLGLLDAHDQKTGGELLKTLEVLFQCHGNLSRTAEQLSLHRNSLLYRLERIEAISGLDLDDPETRLSLQVALKVRQLLEADRTRTG
jgi:purine catabolism regulator